MTEKGSRYVDFLIPGLLGMNLLGTGVWGIGLYVVNSRMNNLLKRLIAAPMRVITRAFQHGLVGRR